MSPKSGLANWAIFTTEKTIPRDVHAEHRALMEATLARDADTACDVAAMHIQRTTDVLAQSAIDSDALSTTTFVLGVQRGLALINSLPGVDAIIIDGSGKLHYSDDLLRSVQAGRQ